MVSFVLETGIPEVTQPFLSHSAPAAESVPGSDRTVRGFGGTAVFALAAGSVSRPFGRVRLL